MTAFKSEEALPEKLPDKEKHKRLLRRYLRQLDMFKTQQSKEKTGFAAPSFLHSVGYAIEGLWFALQQERNLRIDAYLMTGALLLGYLVGLHLNEWIALIPMLCLVVFAELANTTVEWLVDLLTGGQYDLRAKRIKDIAAGGCLIVAVGGYGVSFLIFWPHLAELWGVLAWHI